MFQTVWNPSFFLLNFVSLPSLPWFIQSFRKMVELGHRKTELPDRRFLRAGSWGRRSSNQLSKLNQFSSISQTVWTSLNRFYMLYHSFIPNVAICNRILPSGSEQLGHMSKRQKLRQGATNGLKSKTTRNKAREPRLLPTEAIPISRKLWRKVLYISLHIYIYI